MLYYIYKLSFTAPLHIGDGSLTDGESTINSDTLFSALCHEAVNLECLDEFVAAAEEKQISFSNLFPFVGQTLYLPKPMLSVKTEVEGDSIVKKSFKKLKYIPIQSLETYLKGNLNPLIEVEKLKKLGKFEMRTMSSGRNEEKIQNGEMLPFDVGIYSFSKGCGLYCIVAVENEQAQNLFNQLLYSLSFSGIGGKRSSGFGRFTVESITADTDLSLKINNNSNRSMLLSTAMATQEELPKTLENSSYILLRRAGFVSSVTYSKELVLKKDFYAFKAGSCFSNTFSGKIFDVSQNGNHPVYRYAIPMFLGVE